MNCGAFTLSSDLGTPRARTLKGRVHMFISDIFISGLYRPDDHDHDHDHDRDDRRHHGHHHHHRHWWDGHRWHDDDWDD